ncbi:hypothetical protein EBZ39_00700 [bacterium]|nr:hypothetical protein [bacterium]
MAYETLLNVPAVISAVNAYTINSTSVAATVVFDISSTTLGAAINDENAKLTLSLGKIGTSSTLSATSIAFTLSSATGGNSDNFAQGQVVSSQFATNSAIFTVNFPNSRDLLTTTLGFSANATTIVVTNGSVIDNFFYLNDLRKVRTTAGHSRLVSYLG